MDLKWSILWSVCGPGIKLRQQERHMRYALNIFTSKHMKKKKKQKKWVGGIKDNSIIHIVFAFYHDVCVGSAHNFSVRGNIVKLR